MKLFTLPALVLVVLLIACGGSGLSSQSGADRPSSTSAGPDTGRTAAGNGQLNATTDTMIVINSSISLEVAGVRPAYLQIGQLARSQGGYIANSNITDKEDNNSASLLLRVPATNHDALLGSLRSLEGASVRGESTNAREITEEYTDLQSRLRNLQRSETQHQELLTRANTISEITQVNSQIDGVRGEIERTQGRINLLGNLTDLATINVAVATPPPAASGMPAPVEVLVTMAGLSFVAAHVLVNLAVVAAVFGLWLVPALIAWRLLSKRLRAIGSRLLSW